MKNLNGKEIQIRKAIGLQIKRQLESWFITQEQAAEYAGVTTSQMSAVVNGRTNYTLDTLTKVVIANNLEILLSVEVFKK